MGVVKNPHDLGSNHLIFMGGGGAMDIFRILPFYFRQNRILHFFFALTSGLPFYFVINLKISAKISILLFFQAKHWPAYFFFSVWGVLPFFFKNIHSPPPIKIKWSLPYHNSDIIFTYIRMSFVLDGLFAKETLAFFFNK